MKRMNTIAMLLKATPNYVEEEKHQVGPKLAYNLRSVVNTFIYDTKYCTVRSRELSNPLQVSSANYYYSVDEQDTGVEVNTYSTGYADIEEL